MKYHPNRNDQLWQADLVSFLNHHECEVKFEKADGSLRFMKCTLQPNLVPVTKGTQKPKNKDCLTVFDTEAKGWRTIKFDKLISYTVQNEYVRPLG